MSSACPLRFRSTVFASLHSLRCTCEGDSLDDIAWRLLLDAAGSGIQLALPGNLLADDAPVAASPFSKDAGSLPCWIHSDKHLLSPTTRQCFGEGLSGLLLPSWRTSRSFFLREVAAPPYLLLCFRTFGWVRTSVQPIIFFVSMIRFSYCATNIRHAVFLDKDIMLLGHHSGVGTYGRRV